MAWIVQLTDGMTTVDLHDGTARRLMENGHPQSRSHPNQQCILTSAC